MPEHGRRQHAPIGVTVDVGAADAGVGDLDDHPTRCWLNESLGALPQLSSAGNREHSVCCFSQDHIILRAARTGNSP